MAHILNKKIWTFLFVTLAIATPSYYLIIAEGSLAAANGFLVTALMWAPGFAALITCCIFQRNLKGLGWGLGHIKYLIIGYFIPVVAGLIIYCFVWTTHLGNFSIEIFLDQSSSHSLTLSLFYMASVGVFWYSGMTALGEELGWRGFLAPQLMDSSGYTKAALITSIIWALYHYPVLLFSDYHSSTPTWYALTMFTLSIVGISFVAIWLRIKSNSVWPPVFLHASHNLLLMFLNH